MKLRKKRIIISATACVLILVVCFSYIDCRIKPQAYTLAKTQATGIATKIINEAALEKLGEMNIPYDSLVKIEKDSNGKATALFANTVQINKMKSAITLGVEKDMEQIKKISMSLPLGNLFDSELLSGKGPDIPIAFTNIGGVSSDIKNSFVQAGINQTLHTVYLEISAVISIAVARSSMQITVKTQFAICETVLIGDVPEAYTYIGERVQSDIVGDINDYQAQRIG